MRRSSVISLVVAVALPPLLSYAIDPVIVPPIKPQVPTADRAAGNRVFLEHADVLTKHQNDSFMILRGNVEFTKGPMIMRCDSAHYYTSTESMDAFGNVSMEQGDTLFVYADELNYSGTEEICYLYADRGKKVKLINRDVMLETDEFVYDLRVELGYYTVGGVLTDPSNRLVSQEGEYVPSTKEANFYRDVHLNSRNSSDTLDIYSDTLYYNTNTRIAELHSPSEVVNSRGTIYTSLGLYDTLADTAILFDRSLIVTSDNKTLVADTIFYNRNTGVGEAFGYAVITDSAKHLDVCGDYGYYDQTIDSSFVTGRAELREYRNAEDTLYVHGRYISSWRVIDSTFVEADTVTGTPEHYLCDTTHIAILYPRVRFYRSDMQGLCDSMEFTQRDSTLRMFKHPIVWSEDRQIFGNLIELQLNDSTIRQARLPQFGFTAQAIEGDHYNQMSGKSMTADFVDGEMRRLYIDGNVELIMYPEKADSTINKLVNAESSFLEAWFSNQNTERVKMWPETSGKVTPLFLSRKSMYFLPKFKWYEGLRPMSRADIFTIPKEMDELMESAGF